MREFQWERVSQLEGESAWGFWEILGRIERFIEKFWSFYVPIWEPLIWLRYSFWRKFCNRVSFFV
jgi:hypothetical protein